MSIDSREIEEELNTEIDTENSEELQELQQYTQEETEEEEEEETEEDSNISKKQSLEKQKIRAYSSTTNGSNEKDEDEDEDEEENRGLFEDAIKKYYKLKNEYEESIENQKKKILSMSGLSLKEKRIEFRKLKNKCVNCKRPVGSIFSTKVTGDNDFFLKDRILVALCGDRDDPCPLNIEINLGATNDLRIILIDLEKDLINYKNKIIRDKNDLLFGYITSEEAVRKFDSMKEDMKSTTELYDLFFQQLNEIVDNTKKKEDYQTLLKGFYENIESFKSMIGDFEQSANTQYILDAVELYSNEILPKSKKIMHKTYAYNSVDYDEDDKTYHLYQKKHTIQQFEMDAGETDHGIIYMKIGMPKSIKKTASIVVEERIPALKKGKVRPKLIIKESLTEEEPEPEEEEYSDDKY